MLDIDKIILDIESADEMEILEFDFNPCFDALRKMKALLNEYIADHGNRDSESDGDNLLPAEAQDCSIIERAMILLSDDA